MGSPDRQIGPLASSDAVTSPKSRAFRQFGTGPARLSALAAWHLVSSDPAACHALASRPVIGARPQSDVKDVMSSPSNRARVEAPQLKRGTMMAVQVVKPWSLRSPLVSIVMGLDQHRAQITADWLDTVTGEVGRGCVRPADRVGVHRFLERFVGRSWMSRWRRRLSGCRSRSSPRTRRILRARRRPPIRSRWRCCSCSRA